MSESLAFAYGYLSRHPSYCHFTYVIRISFQLDEITGKVSANATTSVLYRQLSCSYRPLNGVQEHRTSGSAVAKEPSVAKQTGLCNTTNIYETDSRKKFIFDSVEPNELCVQ